MKVLLQFALATLVSVQAQAGFISCTSSNGAIVTARVDGEANLTNLRLTEAGASDASGISLYNVAIDLRESFKLVAAIPKIATVDIVAPLFAFNGSILDIPAIQVGEELAINVDESGRAIQKIIFDRPHTEVTVVKTGEVGWIYTKRLVGDPVTSTQIIKIFAQRNNGVSPATFLIGENKSTGTCTIDFQVSNEAE